MSIMIKTNIGTMPLEDYLDARAMQSGFDDYEDLKRNGYDIEYNKEDCFEENAFEKDELSDSPSLSPEEKQSETNFIRHWEKLD